MGKFLGIQNCDPQAIADFGVIARIMKKKQGPMFGELVRFYVESQKANLQKIAGIEEKP